MVCGWWYENAVGAATQSAKMQNTGKIVVCSLPEWCDQQGVSSESSQHGFYLELAGLFSTAVLPVMGSLPDIKKMTNVEAYPSAWCGIWNSGMFIEDGVQRHRYSVKD